LSASNANTAGKVRGDAGFRDIFRRPLWLAERVRELRQNQILSARSGVAGASNWRSAAPARRNNDDP
jgi:hypothetical protein